jgi:hypothetical protein
VVGFATDDLEAAVELLKEHYACELVRQGERAEGQPLIGASEHGRIQPSRPTYDEGESASALVHVPVQPRRKLR